MGLSPGYTPQCCWRSPGHLVPSSAVHTACSSEEQRGCGSLGRDAACLHCVSFMKDLQTVDSCASQTKKHTWYRPEHILNNDVHELQPGPNKEDDIFHVSRGNPASFKSKHFFHFMFLDDEKRQTFKIFATEKCVSNRYCMFIFVSQSWIKCCLCAEMTCLEKRVLRDESKRPSQIFIPNDGLKPKQTPGKTRKCEVNSWTVWKYVYLFYFINMGISQRAKWKRSGYI